MSSMWALLRRMSQLTGELCVLGAGVLGLSEQCSLLGWREHLGEKREESIVEVIVGGVASGLHGEVYGGVAGGETLGAYVAEVECALADVDFSATAVGEVDELRGDLGGEAELVGGGCVCGYDAAVGLPADGLGDGVGVGRDGEAESFVELREVIEPTADAVKGASANEAAEDLIDRGAAGEVEEIHRDKDRAGLGSLDSQ